MFTIKVRTNGSSPPERFSGITAVRQNDSDSLPQELDAALSENAVVVELADFLETPASAPGLKADNFEGIPKLRPQALAMQPEYSSDRPNHDLVVKMLVNECLWLAQWRLRSKLH